jgi:hypothetical protein
MPPVITEGRALKIRRHGSASLARDDLHGQLTVVAAAWRADRRSRCRRRMGCSIRRCCLTDTTLATDIGTGYYDMNAYASWFLTGIAPALTNDVLFYYYRRQPLASADPAQTTPTHAVGPAGTDNIEVVGFLEAPGTLEITIGGQT